MDQASKVPQEKVEAELMRDRLGTASSQTFQNNLAATLSHIPI